MVDLEYGLSSGLISLSPPHGLGIRGCLGTPSRAHPEEGQGRKPGHCTPLVRALALHGVSGSVGAGSHLGSTLNPGGAVLTLGVFRRSRSVACIRADASPSEVLAQAIVASQRRSVKPGCHTLASIRLRFRLSGGRRARHHGHVACTARGDESPCNAVGIADMTWSTA